MEFGGCSEDERVALRGLMVGQGHRESTVCGNGYLGFSYLLGLKLDDGLNWIFAFNTRFHLVAVNDESYGLSFLFVHQSYLANLIPRRAINTTAFSAV